MANRYATADELPAEFAGVDADFWLNIAKHHVGLDAWGELASDGHILATAHLLASNGLGSSAGRVVASASVGPVSESYATGESQGAPQWSTTVYGQQFEALRAYIGGGPRLTL
jgi:hypothetical protein